MIITLNKTIISQLLPKRPSNAHKNTFGRLNIVAGCKFYKGAALLSSYGALKSGCGLVHLYSIKETCQTVANGLPECILHPMPQTWQGTLSCISGKHIVQEKSDALLCGCGLKNTLQTSKLVSYILQHASVPLILDADALNVIAGKINNNIDTNIRQRNLFFLKNYPHSVTITPHIGEMARLTGYQARDVQKYQQEIAQEFAHQFNCTVVLKSYHTFIANNSEIVYANTMAGNSGMAKGGSGDVLAGIIASLIAQNIPSFKAAATGVWLHATAGDMAADAFSKTSMLPSDIPTFLPNIFKDLNL